MTPKLAINWVFPSCEWGQVRDAFAEFSKSLELDPKQIDARLQLGNLYLLARDSWKAREQAEIVLTKEPNNPSGLLLMSSVNLAEGNLDGASYWAQLILGIAHVRKNDASKASRFFKEAILIDPNNPVGYYQLGRLYLAQKKEKEGLAQLEKSLALNPNYLDPLYLIAAVYVDQKQNRKAIDRVRAQIKTSPKNPFFYGVLGGLYELNKDPDRAECNFLKALQINPNIPDFYNFLGGLYLRRQKVDEAIAEFRAALDKNPNSLSSYMALGMIYESQKNYAQAKEHYLKALKINPKFPPAANNLAYLYAEKGENLDEALSLAQSAKEQVPDDPHISDTLGWVYYKKNIYSRAITYLQEASERNPNNASIHYHLGIASGLSKLRFKK